jgi:hypothetical protein
MTGLASKGLIATLLLLTVGCTGPWIYTDPKLAGSPVPAVKIACESEQTHTVLQGLNAKLYITAINGKSTRRWLTLDTNFPEAAEVAPGRHYLDLMYGKLNSVAHGKVWFDAEEGKHYIARKALRGYSVFFWIEEAGTGKAVGGIPGSEPDLQTRPPPKEF